VAGLVVIAGIVLAAVFAPWLAPYGPNDANLLHPLAGPSAQHLLGTDQLGRDILSRLLWGARPTLLYAIEPLLVTIVAGVPLGLIAGYFGGWTDRTVMWLVDLGLSVPALVVLLIVLSVFQNDFWVALLFFGLLTCPPLVRFIRASAIAVRKEPFIDAALVAGRSHGYIIRRHVLPRIRGAVLVQVTLLSAGGILLLAGLGYLGYGPQPPTPTWGNMVAEAQQVLEQSPWLLIASGGITGLTVLCLGLVGDAVRDVFVEAWAGAPAVREKARREKARRERKGGGGVTHPRYEDKRAVLRTARSLVTVRDLTVTFRRHGADVAVVDGVSFDIEAGQTLALVGESGCGKTTVGRAILGLAGVAGGTVTFDGREVTSLRGDELRAFRGAAIGYVSQEPMSALDPSFRVGAQLAEAVRAHEKLPKGRVVELLEMVRLPDPARVARMYPHELSGGMAQRVCIARALAARPRLLIADEPTTALDVTVQAGILDLLATLRDETGMAILLVSHDWGVVARLCERALVMYAGQVIEQAPLADLVRSPSHPYTKALLACRPELARGGLLSVISGTVPEPEDWPGSCRFAPRCPHAVSACRDSPVSLTAVGPDAVARCVRVAELAGRTS
jgi:peptide/nickel transport system permease protein